MRGQWVKAILVFGATLLYAVPMLGVVTASFKTQAEAAAEPGPWWPKHPTFDNFTTAVNESNLGQAALTSALLTVGSVLLIIAASSTASFALLQFGRRAGPLYWLFVIGLLLPVQLAALPTYKILQSVSLTGTPIGLLLFYGGSFMPFAVFIYVGFMREIDPSYFDSAAIDGAGAFQTYWSIALPLVGPATGTVAILTAIPVLNDLFMPLLILNGSHLTTIPYALNSFVGMYGAKYNLIFASVLLVSVPLLLIYIFLQDRLIKGFAGGVKG